jgi:threonine dehydrogenase-like Zn-dependent dehydrogenase
MGKAGQDMRGLAAFGDGKAGIVELPMPTHDDCRLLVKTLSCGICNGTDMKIIHGQFKNIDAYPTLVGHEAVGVVVETGRRVKQFREGDLILLPFIEGGLGGYHSAWGGFCEYGVCGDWKAMAEAGTGPGTEDFLPFYYTQKLLPRDFDPVTSAMIITFREVLAATREFGFSHNQSLVIFGAGPVGLCFIKFTKLLGLGPVIAVDISDDKQSEAARAGADHFINSSKTDAVEAIKKICPGGADHVLDAVGINQLIITAMDIIKDDGQICTYGISPNCQMHLDWSSAPYNWRLRFLQFPKKEGEGAAHEQIINWIRAGVIRPDEFISHVFPFEQIHDAINLVESKSGFKKIIIKY